MFDLTPSRNEKSYHFTISELNPIEMSEQKNHIEYKQSAFELYSHNENYNNSFISPAKMLFCSNSPYPSFPKQTNN